MKSASIIAFPILAFLLVPALNTYAAEGDSLWSNRFGGDDDDFAWALVQAADGSYVLAGYTESFGSGWDDMWAVKANNLGDSLWSNSLGTNNSERAEAIVLAEDGGYLLAGWATGSGSDYVDMWLVKLSADGDSLWSHCYGGDSIDWARSLTPAFGGGYVLAGNTGSYGAGAADLWVLRVDSNGDSLWSQTFGGSSAEWAYDIIQTSDGGYAAAGATSSFGAGLGDMWLVKMSANGDSLWSRTYGGGYSDDARSVIQTSDGGFFLAGKTLIPGLSGVEMWIVRTNENGDSLWSRTFGGTGSDEAWSIIEADDGNYLIAGMTESFGSGAQDMWLVKMSADGDSLWSRTYGGAASDGAYGLIQDSTGDYILAGYSWSFSAGRNDMWLVCAEGPSLGITTLEPHIPFRYSMSVHPNPFNPTTTLTYHLPKAAKVELNVYDVIGSLVTTLSSGWHPAGEYNIVFDGSDLASGIYLARLTTGEFTKTQKLVLLK